MADTTEKTIADAELKALSMVAGRNSGEFVVLFSDGSLWQGSLPGLITGEGELAVWTRIPVDRHAWPDCSAPASRG